ncbi:MAG: hypothetical protein R3C02_14375 [Planctomycetaceae bacterium]
MEAKEYLDLLRDEKDIIRLAHYADDRCDGRGNAVIIDTEHNIAVMMEDCGDPDATLIKAGALVQYIEHPEAEPKIVGSPAYVSPVVLGGRKLR